MIKEASITVARNRFPLLGRLLLGLLWGATSVVAQTPEPLPPYSDARSLRADASLHAVEFWNESVGVAVGDRGTILRTGDGGESWKLQESGVTCRLQDVHWISGRTVVVIGGAYDRVTRLSRGVVLKSDDGGTTWQRVGDEDLPFLKRFTARPGAREIAARGDYSFIALTGDFVGSHQGQVWQGNNDPNRPRLLPPKQSPSSLRAWSDAVEAPVMIRGACRVAAASGNRSPEGQADSPLVWAVGDHGVIVRSTDGGHHWQFRRGENRRSAILIVAASPDSVAFPVIGNEALEIRHRVSVVVDAQIEQDSLDLLRQVTVMLGGAGADAMGDEEIQQAAADWIAIHRPAVLVLDENLSSETETAFSEAAIRANVPRIVSYAFQGRGDTMLHRNAMLPRRGVLLADLWEDALQLIAPDRRPSTSVALRRRYDATGASQYGDTVTAGLPIATGCRLSAPTTAATRRQLQVVQARMARPKQVDRLIATSKTADGFSTSLGAMLDQTSKEDRFRFAWSVLLRAINPKERSSPLKATTLEEAALQVIAERFPETSAGKWALLRHEALAHSVEWNHLRTSVGKTIKPDSVAAADTVPVSPFQVDTNPLQQVSAVSPVVVPEVKQYELTPKNQAAEVDLAWEFHPLVLVTREAARHRGDDGPLQKAGNGSANLRRLLTGGGGAWGQLLRNDGASTVVASRTETRPRLDGIADDPCWAAALPRATDSSSFRIAYDDEFVYVAASWPADRFGTDAADSRSGRSRDHDLTGTDRMRLRIDTDLDLMTFMDLQVSDGGRTHDSIDGHSGWNPEWYVQVARTAATVTVEMAILRRDLSELPIHAGQSWFVSAAMLTAGISDPWQPMTDPSDWRRVVFR